MAELKLFDIPGAFNQGFDRGTAQRKTNALNMLAGQAYAAAPQDRDSLIQQAIQNDAQSGLQLGQSLRTDEDARTKGLVNMARMLTSAPEGQRAGLYQQMIPSLQRFGLQQLPPQYDETVAQTAQALVQAYTPAGQGGPYADLPSDIRSLKLLQENPELAELDRQRRQAAGMVPKLVETAEGYGWGTPGGGIRLAPLDGVAGQSSQPSAPAEQLFAALGQKYGIQPTSVRRTPQRNQEVGGVENSYHLSGQAADWVVPQPYKQQFMADARANGFEAIDEGDHIHIEPAGQRRGGARIPTPAENAAAKAGASEAAKLAAQLETLPAELRMRVESELQKQQGSAQITAGTEQQKKQVERNAVFAQYQAAVDGLKSGLSNATTGPVAGRLPAVTANQQIAEGAVAALAPVLKQLFRAAGEGTFTDRDQQLLLDMVPTRTDLPAAREAKLQNIDNIVRAKLGQGGMYGAAPADGPAQPAAGGVLRYNPATGDFE